MSFYYLSITHAVVGAAFAVLTMEIVSFIGYFLANSIRRTVLTKVIIPYGSYFSISFILLYYLLSKYPFIAMLSTILLVSTMVLLFDETIKSLLVDFKKKQSPQDNNGLTDGR